MNRKTFFLLCLMGVLIFIGSATAFFFLRHTENTAIVEVDFVDSFPYVFAISNWSKDSGYPNGFRYKILSTRNAKSDKVEIAVILEEPNQAKTIMTELETKKNAAGGVIKKFIDGLSKEYQISFDYQDLSSITNQKDFEKQVKELGWYEFK